MVKPEQPKRDSRSRVRRVFDVAERAVATRAEPVTQSGGFASVLSKYVAVNRRIGGVLGRATGGLLHVVNIPTASDIRNLHQHLSSVDSHIAELITGSDRLAAAAQPVDGDTDPPAPRGPNAPKRDKRATPSARSRSLAAKPKGAPSKPSEPKRAPDKPSEPKG